MTSIYEFITSMCIFWMLLGVCGSSICFISNLGPIISKRHCFPCTYWKLSKKWLCCKLNDWLVHSCRLRPKNLPPRLDGSLFLAPYCDKHRRWRRDRARAKAFFNRRQMDNFFCGRKDGYCFWESEGVSKTSRDSLCDDENRDFLQLHRLLSSFTNLDHVETVSDSTQKENLLRGQILENMVLPNSDLKDTRTMMLVWDTVDSYGLTSFNSDFIDYL